MSAEVEQVAERFGLLDVLDRRTDTLPYGKQRLLEIAAAFACAPQVLLLDEPAAGVPEAERRDILDAIAALPEDVSVLLIEHDMDLVFSFARRISVLVDGALLVEGEPEAIAADSARARRLSRREPRWLSSCPSRISPPATAAPSCCPRWRFAWTRARRWRFWAATA